MNRASGDLKILKLLKGLFKYNPNFDIDELEDALSDNTAMVNRIKDGLPIFFRKQPMLCIARDGVLTTGESDYDYISMYFGFYSAPDLDTDRAYTKLFSSLDLHAFVFYEDKDGLIGYEQLDDTPDMWTSVFNSLDIGSAFGSAMANSGGAVADLGSTMFNLNPHTTLGDSIQLTVYYDYYNNDGSIDDNSVGSEVLLSTICIPGSALIIDNGIITDDYTKSRVMAGLPIRISTGVGNPDQILHLSEISNNVLTYKGRTSEYEIVTTTWEINLI